MDQPFDIRFYKNFSVIQSGGVQNAPEPNPAYAGLALAWQLP
jgi:hypothetical protein